MKGLKNRGLSLLLALSLLLTLLVLPVAAADADPLARFSGSGTRTDPFLIATAEDLAAMRDFVNTADGDQSGYYWRQTADISLADYANWTPIGVSTKTNATMETRYRFSGVYDGDGYAITDMTIDASGTEAVGLFGNISRAVIRDLTVAGNITHTTATGHSANYGLGGVAGRSVAYYEPGVTNPDGSCELIGVTSRVNITAAAMAGGVLGTTEVDTVFENCVYEGAITLTMASGYSYDIYGTGGICGTSQGDDRFTGCVNRGSITTTQGDVSMGGIVGFAGNAATTTVESCYNTGTLTSAVTSGNTGVGGIVGKRTNGYASDNNEQLMMSIKSCYNAGQLTAADKGTTGGIVGRCVAFANNGGLLWTEENFSNAYALKDKSAYLIRALNDSTIMEGPTTSTTTGLERRLSDIAEMLSASFKYENENLILPWESASARFGVEIIAIDAVTGREFKPAVDLDYEFGLAPGRYGFTASSAGYEPVESSLAVVRGDKTVYVIMTPASAGYTLTVVPADARITVENEFDAAAPQSVTVGENAAVYVYKLNPYVYGDYAFTAEAYGYTARSWTVDDAGDARVELSEAPVRRVTVSAGETALEAVAVTSTRFGVSPAAETDGSFLLPDGAYLLTAYAAGYQKISQTFTVSGADLAVDVTPTKDVWDGTADTDWYDTAAARYEIRTTAELAGLAQLVNRGVTFEGRTVALCADLDLGGRLWTPIGSSTEVSFRGTFDGAGHSISGLLLNAPKVVPDDANEGKYLLKWPDNVGLFGYVSGAVVEDLTINIASPEFDLSALKEQYGDALIESENGVGCAGGAAAFAVKTAFRRVVTTGDLAADGNRVGGLVGEARGCAFTACANRAAVSGGYGVGGIAGQCDAATGLYACANYGDISGWFYKFMDNKTGHGVGGLVGLNYSLNAAMPIEASANFGAVRGNSMLGGLLGAGRADIRDSYNAGAVAITADEVTVAAATVDADGNPVDAVMGVQTGLYAGGLAGYSAALTVTNSFSRGSAADESGVAGNTANALVGTMLEGTVSDSYYKTGTDTNGTQCDTLSAETLGEAFLDGEDGWPVLSWESAGSRYTVTFAVTRDTDANNGRALTITVNGEAIDGTAATLSAGRYAYTAVQDGYAPVSGYFEVVGKAVTVPVALTAERYTLTVRTDADFALTQRGGTVAPVSVGSGVYTYTLYNGTYAYTAVQRNHNTERGEISVAFADAEKTVTLRSADTHSVQFSVTRGGAAFYDWTATITDADGVDYGAVTAADALTLMDGTYTYRLTAPGCETVNGSFTVGGAALTVEAAMESRKASVWDGSIDTAWYDAMESSFTIYTAAELAGLAQLVNKGTTFSGKTVALENDLDLGALTWTAIGTYYQKPFSGEFDGNGHTISGKGTYTSSNAVVLGLFGYTDKASIHDLLLTGERSVSQSFTAYTTACVGTLIGWASATTVKNVSNRGSLTVNVNTSAFLFDYVGGLVGKAANDTQIIACNNVGAVSLNVVTTSYAYPYAGGIVGEVDGDMTGCYNSGAVGTDGGSIARVGGLIGAFAWGSLSAEHAKNNYAVGAVSAGNADTPYVSALIGGQFSADASNYYLNTLTADGGTAKSAEELQSAETAAALGEHFRYTPGTYPMNTWEAAAASVTVSRLPDKTVYQDLEAFDATGMELTVTYANGATAVVTGGWVVRGGASLAPGQTQVIVTYLGCSAAVPITVTQTTHYLGSADLALALPAPQAGETGGEPALTDAQRAVFTANAVWMHAGEPFTGTFAENTYYYAAVTLSIAARTDTLYAFAADAVPGVSGAYEILNTVVSEDGKTLTCLVTFRAGETLTDRASHLYYEGIDASRAALLDETVAVTLNGGTAATFTVRELETLALAGLGAETGGFTGVPLRALLQRLVGLDLLGGSGTVALGGKTYTVDALRESDALLLAYGENGAPLSALTIPDGGAVTSIDIKAARAGTYTVRFLGDAAVSGTVLTVRDSHGSAVYTGPLAALTLREGETYSYLAETPGYADMTGTVSAAGTVTVHFVAVWNGEYTEPERDESGAYLIASAENLAWFHRESTRVSLERARELASASVKLTADISMAGYDWTPICPTEASQTLFYPNDQRYYGGGMFTGTIDGGGHTIYDLSIDWSRGYDNLRSRMEAYGLIGFLRGGTVRDLGVRAVIRVTDGSATEGDWLCVGGIAGFAQSGAVITGCYADADITVTATDSAANLGVYVGGIAGAVSSPLETVSAIENSYSTGSARVSGPYALALGGVAGSSRAGSSRFDRCWSDMDLTLDPAGSSRTSYLGGIIGLIDSVSSDLPEVSFCFALNDLLDGGDAARSCAGRVVGQCERFGDEGSYNFALDTMTVRNADTSGYDADDSGYRSGWGSNVTREAALGETAFTDVNWNYNDETDEETAIWDFSAPDRYPQLAWETGNAPEPVGFAVTVENLVEDAAVSLTDGTYAGAQRFTVRSAKACAVLACVNGEWTALTPEREGEGYAFTLTVEADTLVRVILRGDLNADGTVNSTDAALARRIAAGLEPAAAEQLLNLGVQRISGIIALRVQRAAAELYGFGW